MTSGSLSILKGSEVAFLYECDPCKYQNLTREAKAYCSVCTEYLCKTCRQSHNGLNATRDHKLLTGKDMNSVSMTTKPNVPAIFCDIHKTMTVDTYCKSHDDIVCHTCKMTDHSKCVTSEISDQTNQGNITLLLGKAVKSLTILNREFEKLKESRRNDTPKVIAQLRKCLDDMRSMRKEINQTFDKLEREFEKDVREAEQRIKKEIEDHVAIADGALTQIADQIKDLEELKKTKKDDVMFVGMKKANKLKSKYDQTLCRVQQAIYPIQIRFRANDIIRDILQQHKSIGTLDRLENSSLQMPVVDKREIDVGTRSVFDCTFMKTGHLVLACRYDGLVLLDESFMVESVLSVTAYRVAAINESEVVVIQGDDQLLRLRLFPQMVVMTTVKMDRWCHGVDVFNNEIYVACYDSEGHGEVQVLNMDGKIQRKLGVNNGEYMFTYTNGVKVSRDESRIIACDVSTHEVTCLNQQRACDLQVFRPKLETSIWTLR